MSEILVEAVAEKRVPQQLVNTFSPLVNEAKIHFNDDGIHMRAVDAANIAMHYVDLSAEAFESYDSPGAVTQGVNLGSIDDRLGFGDSGDMVHLALDMETRKLNIDVENFEQRVALIDPDAIRQEPDLPDLDLPNTAVLTGEQLQQAVDALELVSDHVEIAADADAATVEFIGEGDTDDTTVTFDSDRTGDETKLLESVASLYSQEYMEKLVKPIPADAEVTMQFGEEFPVILDWTAVDGHLTVKSMLAPRIRSN